MSVLCGCVALLDREWQQRKRLHVHLQSNSGLVSKLKVIFLLFWPSEKLHNSQATTSYWLELLQSMYHLWQQYLNIHNKESSSDSPKMSTIFKCSVWNPKSAHPQSMIHRLRKLLLYKHYHHFNDVKQQFWMPKTSNRLWTSETPKSEVNESNYVKSVGSWITEMISKAVLAVHSLGSHWVVTQHCHCYLSLILMTTNGLQTFVTVVIMDNNRLYTNNDTLCGRLSLVPVWDEMIQQTIFQCILRILQMPKYFSSSWCMMNCSNFK